MQGVRRLERTTTVRAPLEHVRCQPTAAVSAHWALIPFPCVLGGTAFFEFFVDNLPVVGRAPSLHAIRLRRPEGNGCGRERSKWPTRLSSGDVTLFPAHTHPAPIL